MELDEQYGISIKTFMDKISSIVLQIQLEFLWMNSF